MITIKNESAISRMAQAGALLATMFQQLSHVLEPGKSTADIDAWIDNYLRAHNLVSSSRGYMGYRHVSCISLNDEVVHGVPHADRILKEHDLVKVDVCASLNGYCADMARSFFIGSASAEAQKLVDVAQSALDKGIQQVQEGERLSNISAAIQKEVESHGYGVVREFAGHGIGKKMHEDPEILNYGKPGCGPVMRAGMAFAIEPMITLGSYKIYVARDGWTVKTVDKSLAAHVEDTVVVTQHGPQILTRI
jgi:methionyl aminopeptidase